MRFDMLDGFRVELVVPIQRPGFLLLVIGNYP